MSDLTLVHPRKGEKGSKKKKRMYKEFDMRGVGKKSTLSKTGFGATTDK